MSETTEFLPADGRWELCEAVPSDTPWEFRSRPGAWWQDMDGYFVLVDQRDTEAYVIGPDGWPRKFVPREGWTISGRDARTINGEEWNTDIYIRNEQSMMIDFRPLGEEWIRCKAPRLAPQSFRQLSGTWWKHRDGYHVLAVQDGNQCSLHCYGESMDADFSPRGKWRYAGCSFGLDIFGTCIVRYERPEAPTIYERPETREERRVRELRALPELVMHRLAEARHKHPEPQAIGLRILALESEMEEVRQAFAFEEGDGRVKDELIDVIVVAVRALTEEWAGSKMDEIRKRVIRLERTCHGL